MSERRAKIVATLGPACNTEDQILGLINSGINVARLNFSHGTHEDHLVTIRAIRKLSKAHRYPLTILLDLQGPKIRTGNIEGGSVHLDDKQKLVLSTRPITGNKEIICIDYADITKSIKIGGRILIDDGQIELKILDFSEERISTQVLQGGELKPNKGVNFPGAQLSVQAITEKDKEDLRFGLENGVDAIALSFVKSAQDIMLLRQEFTSISLDYRSVPIIAKLERPEAIKNLHEIIHAADGVMVARGDLGVEMSPEEVPIVQKEIIQMANRHLKIVITATQMLDSMIRKPRPTRAEASDVANAIFDGSDALMLSGETAVGDFPLKSVSTMSQIITKAESHIFEWGKSDYRFSKDLPHDDAMVMMGAAKEIAKDREVSAIAVFTMSGRTARLISKSRPTVPILAFTPVNKTYQKLNLYWGVTPILIPEANSVEEMLDYVESAILTKTDLSEGQEFVLIAGFPVGSKAPANFSLIHKIGLR